MVVVGALRGDSAAAVTDELFGGCVDDLQGFFDDAAVEVAATAGEREEELEWLSNKDAFPTLDTMEPPAEAGLVTALPRAKGVRRPRPVVAGSPPPVLSPWPRAPAKAGHRCRHCGTDETPQWCKGPEGARSLCNACGMRFRMGKLLPEYRPAKSPTFSPVLHSNKHRRVVELARRRKVESAIAFPAAAASD